MNKIKLINKANKENAPKDLLFFSLLEKEIKSLGMEFELIEPKLSKKFPSWLSTVLFNSKICREKENSFYISRERISCTDIYKIDDGLYNTLLSSEKKSKLKLLHKVKIALEKKAIANAKKIVVTSNLVKNDVIQTYDIKPEKIEVIYNGIKLYPPNFKYSFKKLKKKFDIKEEDKIIVFVGNDFKKNGLKEFLEIISNIQDENLKAFIVGKDKKMKRYIKLARKLGLEGKIVFTGFREDVRDFYTISDICIFPTYYNSFSDSVIEAMSCQSVVFTTSTNGASEILEDEYIMKSPDDMSVVKVIEELLNNHIKLNAQKEKNLNFVQNFSIENNVIRKVELIKECMTK